MLMRSFKVASVPKDVWVSIDALSKIWGCSTRVIKEWAKEEKVRCKKVGHIWILDTSTF
jgi:hypothetical protein